MNENEAAGANSAEESAPGQARARQQRKRSAATTVPRDAPASLEAERAVLGSILFEPDALATVLPLLEPTDFFDPDTKATYLAMRCLHDEGTPVDLVTVANQLNTLGALPGPLYVSGLLAGVGTSAQVTHHAKIVLEKAHLRCIIRKCEATVDEAYAGANPMDLAEKGSVALDMVRASAFAADETSIPGAWTFEDVDRVLGQTSWLWPGWIPNGLLSMLVGYSDIGKSKLALRICQSVLFPELPWPGGTPQTGRNGNADQDKVCWLDLEATHTINRDRIKALGMPMDRVMFPQSPTFKDDPTADVPLGDLRELRTFEHWCRFYRPKLVIIDSLRGVLKGDENSSKDVAIIYGFAKLAQRLGIAMVLIHHLNKPKENDLPNEVTPTRVRGSGAIIAAVSACIAMDRPDPQSKAIRVHAIRMRSAMKPIPFGLMEQGSGFVGCVAPEAPRKESKTAIVGDLLAALLQHGPRPVTELRQELEDAGHAWGTAKRAKDARGIIERRESVKGGKHGAGRWMWSLPGHGVEPQAEAIARDDARAQAERSEPEPTQRTTPDPGPAEGDPGPLGADPILTGEDVVEETTQPANWWDRD